MKLRLLSENDIPYITELYAADFSDGWNADMLLSAFKGGRFLCVGAFTGKLLVGVITCTKGLDDADIEGVVTRKEYRQRGIADVLVKFALNELAASGAKKLFLEVRKSNAPAIALYQKHGFNEISIRKKYYADGEDALVFIKEN